MDNRVGNTDGLGAAFGILSACGVKVGAGWPWGIAASAVGEDT